MLRCKMAVALAHQRHATLQDVSCTCPPTLFYVVRCMLLLPTDVMLRCNMFFALAATCGHLWDMMKNLMFRFNAGGGILNVLGKLAEKCE